MRRSSAACSSAACSSGSPLGGLTLVPAPAPQLRYHNYLHKRHLVNPTKSGPFHFRAPSRILYKAIRGMVRSCLLNLGPRLPVARS